MQCRAQEEHSPADDREGRKSEPGNDRALAHIFDFMRKPSGLLIENGLEAFKGFRRPARLDCAHRVSNADDALVS
jgi:hypothetical protein